MIKIKSKYGKFCCAVECLEYHINYIENNINSYIMETGKIFKRLFLNFLNPISFWIVIEKNILKKICVGWLKTNDVLINKINVIMKYLEQY